jgi:exocyst complex component 3
MADVDASTLSLSDLLRHPDDLNKISAIKADIIRKKATLDSELREGLQEQVESIKNGMSSISESQKTVDEIKAELQKIDKLCSEAQTLIQDYPDLKLLSITLRNFTVVKKMKEDIELFERRLQIVEQMLMEDEVDLENQERWYPNLLPCHYELSKLRDLKDSALDQAQRSEKAKELISNLTLSSGTSLQDYFSRLDQVVEVFDDHLRVLCENQLYLVTRDRSALVRLNLIINDEERRDKQSRALQDAKDEYQALAGRFESITAPKRQIRGYKDAFLAVVGTQVQQQLDEQNGKFSEDPDRLEKLMRFWFNNLNMVKKGMEGERLVPPKWKIFQSYSITYHKAMHDWLIGHIDDPELRPPQMLAIVNWSDKYYEKCKVLGLDENWLQPHVIDDRASELIREYRELIIKAVDEWMDRMAKTDSQAFESREEGGLEQDENGLFRTKTAADMWRMLSQQLDVAASSQRVDIVEGVVDAMFRALQSRQRMWEQLIDSTLAKYESGAQTDNPSTFQDWLIAIANDQIACIDDTDMALGYLTRFSNEAQQMVSDSYWNKASLQLMALRDGYVDLSTHCLAAFAAVIFACDFRSLMTEFFTPTWYTKLAMTQATRTFADYLEDYRKVLHPSLVDILANELSSRLLSGYLSSVRNKGVKFRRADPFEEKFRQDITTVFEFFQNFPDAMESIKQDWRAVEGLVNLLAEEKSRIPDVYQEFKERFWDAGMSWVEAVLKSRDDYDRSLMNGVKMRAAAMEVVRGDMETIMSRVK